MNWKDCPNLFANGKFKISYYQYHSDSFKEFDYNLHTAYQHDLREPDCLLIARPISDMTDEEWKFIYSKYTSWSTLLNENEKQKIRKQFKREIIEEYNIGSEEFIHLLSIGVYPFDDEEDVIFKSKNEE